MIMTGGTTADQVRLLETDLVDLGLLRAPVTLPAGLSQVPVAEEGLGIVLPASHPLAASRELDARDLAGAELIMFARDLSPGLMTASWRHCVPAVARSRSVTARWATPRCCQHFPCSPARSASARPAWPEHPAPIWDTIAGDGKTARLEAMAARLPAGRVGTPADIAQAISALITNPFITGTVLHADGGQRLV
jgi:hypothetical protein